MTSNEEDWPHGTPERALADAFAAFRRRDVEHLAALVTSASFRSLAVHLVRELDERESGATARSTGELTDSEATAIYSRFMARLPEQFTDSVRCQIVGHIVDVRLDDELPDGRGLVGLECRVAGAGDEWLSVRAEREMLGEVANRDAGVAHVVFRVAFEFPGERVVPFPLEPEVARARLVDGEWKLDLDPLSGLGLPGFRGVGIWVDK